MPKDDQQIDAGGTSVASMSAEQIDAALAGVIQDVTQSEAAAESKPVAAQAPEVSAGQAVASDSSNPSELDAAGSTSGRTQADQQPAETGSPPTDLPTEAGPDPAMQAAADSSAPPPENQSAPAPAPDTTTADTEAALDRIDADLADLESLLAQTAADGTSIPESIAQAPPPPPDQPPETSEETDATGNDTDATDESAAGDASDAGASDAESLEQEVDGTTGSEDLLLEDMSGSVPDLSDSTETPSSEKDSPQAQPAAAAAAEVISERIDDSLAGMFERLLTSIILTPMMVIDMPFARLNSRVKNVLGLAGIATLLVALTTWLVGSFR